MKFIISRPALFIALFSLTAVFCNFSCSKEDKADTDNPDDPDSGSPDVIPDDNTTYIAYYAKDMFNQSGDDRMMVVSAATIAPLRISVSGDTTYFNLIFSNYNLKNDKYRTNSWYVCDSTYDEKGHDNFNVYCTWTGGITGKLEVGREYNCAGFKDGVSGTLPYSESWGLVGFRHISASGKEKYSCNTYFGGVDVLIKYSYIKFDKIENGKATGTFQFGFHAGCSMSGGFPYGNNVVGKFNKIAIE